MIERAPFGRTGHLSSRVIFGAAAFSKFAQEKADAFLPKLVEAGINHIDTAASYGDSELRLAPWLRTNRDTVFLASKTRERTGEAARAELESSLERLGVDRIDLIQLHNLVEPDEWETAHAPGGAVEAMVKARDEGLVRFIGVTGHGLRICGMHLRSLERFPFDSVLFPYNVTLLDDPTYRGDVEDLLGVCAEQEVAVQTIKAVARRRWTERTGKERSWYEPLTDPAAIHRAVRFVLSNPQVFLNTTSDLTVVPHVLQAAAGNLTKPTDEEMAADVVAHDMTPLFDGDALERI